MKYKFLITILAVVTLIITSCSKSKPPYIPDTSSNNVSATISIGSNAPFQFSVTGAKAKMYPETFHPSYYDIEVTGANNNHLFITLENVTHAGTYPFTSNNNGIGSRLDFIIDLGSISQVTYSTSDPSIANKGSVTITAFNNHHIEGLFTAFCKNGHGEAAQVSNGSFKGNF